MLETHLPHGADRTDRLRFVRFLVGRRVEDLRIKSPACRSLPPVHRRHQKNALSSRSLSFPPTHSPLLAPPIHLGEGDSGERDMPGIPDGGRGRSAGECAILPESSRKVNSRAPIAAGAAAILRAADDADEWGRRERERPRSRRRNLLAACRHRRRGRLGGGDRALDDHALSRPGPGLVEFDAAEVARAAISAATTLIDRTRTRRRASGSPRSARLDRGVATRRRGARRAGALLAGRPHRRAVPRLAGERFPPLPKPVGDEARRPARSLRPVP